MGRISSSRTTWILLSAITVLAAVLRLWQIGESMWVDELHTSWCVQAGFWQVGSRAMAGNQGPAYFYLVWALTRLLGESEFTLRLPSLVAGIALPGMTWLLVRQIWSLPQVSDAEDRSEARDWSALLAALLVAIDHASIFYATEARPYACVQLLAVGVLLAALQDRFRPSQASPLWFMLSSAALLYLHYTAGLYLAALLAVLLVWSVARPSDSYNWQSWLVDVGGIAALSAPCFQQVYDIALRRDNWESFVQQPTVASLLRLYPWIVAPLGLLGLCYSRRAGQLLPQGLPLLVAAAAGPLLIAWGLSYWKVALLFHPRYLVAALPPLWAAVAMAAVVPRQRWMRVCSTLAIVGLAMVSSGIWDNYGKEGRFLTARREHWRQAVPAAGEQHSQHPDWKVLVHSGLIETNGLRQARDENLRAYGLLPVRALYSLRAEDRSLIPLPMREPGKLTPETRDEVVRSGGAIVILRLAAVDAVTVEEDLLKSIAEKNARAEVVSRQAFGNVQVLVLRIGSSPR